MTAIAAGAGNLRFRAGRGRPVPGGHRDDRRMTMARHAARLRGACRSGSMMFRRRAACQAVRRRGDAGGNCGAMRVCARSTGWRPAFDVTRQGRDGLHVAGEVQRHRRADVRRHAWSRWTSTVEEQVDLDFLPASAAAHARTRRTLVDDGGDDPPELLADGIGRPWRAGDRVSDPGHRPLSAQTGRGIRRAAAAKRPKPGPFAALAKLKSRPRTDKTELANRRFRP